MNKENTLTIKFGKPEHGWLPTKLSYNDFELSLDISDVPVDPMLQLCDSLIQITKGIKKPDRILWHLEPYCYYLQIEKMDSDYKVTLSESDSFESLAKITKEIRGSFEELILPLYRGVNKFASYSYLPPHWEELDLKRIDELTDLIRKMKGM